MTPLMSIVALPEATPVRVPIARPAPVTQVRVPTGDGTVSSVSAERTVPFVVDPIRSTVSSPALWTTTAVSSSQLLNYNDARGARTLSPLVTLVCPDMCAAVHVLMKSPPAVLRTVELPLARLAVIETFPLCVTPSTDSVAPTRCPQKAASRPCPPTAAMTIILSLMSSISHPSALLAISDGRVWRSRPYGSRTFAVLATQST